MRSKNLVLFFLCCLCFTSNNAQTPQSPIINWAMQYFSPSTGSDVRHNLVISQGISPRVFKPYHPSGSEKVTIMFIGHWLDITDEVVVTAPGVSGPRGIVASSISGGNRFFDSRFVPNSVFRSYNGAYTMVDFVVSSDAAIGTHTVRLKRPRLGPGKDEAVFYIEVYDAVRIRSIRYSNNLSTRVSMGNRGKVIIDGDNLDRIDSIGSVNGMLTNIINFTKTPTRITFTATFSKKGYLGYAALMNSVYPARLKNIEYPTQFDNIKDNTHQPHGLTVD